MKRNADGTYTVPVPGSVTGSYRIHQGLRYDFMHEGHTSMDATMFIPAGYSNLMDNGMFKYTQDPLTLRPGQ